MAENSEKLRTTLINSKDGKLDDKSIKILSIDFAYLICNSNYKNDSEETILFDYEENDRIYLYNFDFIKNIKYNYNIKEKPYISTNNLKFKNLSKGEEFISSKYSNIIKIKGKILKSHILDSKVKSQFDNFVINNFFSESPDDIFTNKLIDYIFVPNKASQKVLSTTGSEIDINAFFLHYLSHDPEPLFYLEEKGGYIRKYSLTIILDISKSVMNEFNKGHSFYTIKTLFKFLRFIDIPNLDVIVATGGNPLILCCGLSSRKILKKGSDFWIALINSLSNPKEKTYVSPCIDIAFYLNMERTDYINYLFVLTDGLFNETENDNILQNISKCIQYNIKVFGIGLGFYPLNINQLFPNTLYAKSSEKLFNAIAYFFDKCIDVNNDKFQPLLRDVSNYFEKTIYNLTNNYKENIITQIKEILQNKFVINYQIFDSFNKPKDTKDMKILSKH